MLDNQATIVSRHRGHVRWLSLSQVGRQGRRDLSNLPIPFPLRHAVITDSWYFYSLAT